MIKNVEFKNEQDGNTNFLYITISKEVGINMLQVQRLADGLRYGLIPCLIIPKVSEYIIRYTEVSKTTLDDFVVSGLTKDRLLHILRGTISAMEKAQEKGLSVENLVLDKKHIYLDSFSNKLLFIFLPVRNNVFEKVSMKEFVIDLMLSAPFDENDDLYFYIKLQNYVTGDKEFTLAGLKEVLAEWDEEPVLEPQEDVKAVGEPVAGEVPVAVEESEKAPDSAEPENEALTAKEEGFGDSSAAAKAYSAPSDDFSPNFYSPDQASIPVQASIAGNDELKPETIIRNNKLKNENGKRAPFKWFTSTKQAPESVGKATLNDTYFSNTVDEGTTVLSQQDDGTTILGVKSAEASIKPFLVANVSGEETVIDKDEFKMGRDPLRSHFVINNKVVGRLHAKILSVEGEYFLEDVSSRNGTFVNGIRVTPGEKVKIRHDDGITLANEGFTFRTY